MKIVYTTQRLKELIDEMSMIFRSVRIVDPASTNVLTINDNYEISDTRESCYAFWKKRKRCSNCISMRALDCESTLCKLENTETEVIRVISKAIDYTYGGETKKAIIEILNDTTHEVVDLEEVEFSNKLIYEDSLTKAFNRRFFDDGVYSYFGLDRELEHFGFIMCDMRKFKNINDSYGHQKGDEMLKAFSDCIRKIISEDDLLIRIGGDEFLIVIRSGNTDYPGLISEIRSAVQQVAVSDDDSLYLDVNCGYAIAENDSLSITRALADADEMMYNNKRQ